MMKSCTYCGGIHDSTKPCVKKKEAIERRQGSRKNTGAYKLHHSNKWARKSRQIRNRDGETCLCCKALLPGTIRQYNTSNLSVHHIVPIAEDETKAMDDDNLITVCSTHHELCESGSITREQQRELIKESAGQQGQAYIG